MKVQLASILAVSMVLTACNGSSDDSSTTPAPGVEVEPVNDVEFESISGTAARQQQSVDDTQMLVLAQNNNKFATDFYRQQLSGNEGKNLVMSPFSISNAFAMLYSGSAYETKQEIRDTFYFEQEDTDFHQAFNTLSQRLLAYESDDDFKINIVNAQWGEVTYDFSQEYLNNLSQFYGADIKVADIIGQYDAVRVTINAWVEEQTESLVQDLLPESTITSDTRLVLTNAVYFNAKWLDEFNPNETSERGFSLVSGEEIQVPTMQRRGDFNAYSENEQILVELGYKNPDWSMYLITVPAEQFSTFEAGFDSTQLDDMLDKASVQDIEVFVPKFSFGSKANLKESLEPMGMRMAFDGSTADFSLINQRQEMELFIQAAVHQAFITVDESGTEAGAATAIGVGIESSPPAFLFDQPFVFVIKHKPSDTNLFLGRVMNPLE